jgi:hypothetical protein
VVTAGHEDRVARQLGEIASSDKEMAAHYAVIVDRKLT